MKRLFGSVIAVLFVTIFASAAFAQAPREIAPPQEVSGPQETNGLKLEATPEVWSGQGKSLELVVPDKVKREIKLSTPTSRPFPNVQSGGGTVLYAHEGVRLANPLNVSFLFSSLAHYIGNIEKGIEVTFREKKMPVPFPLAKGEKNLVLRVEAIPYLVENSHRVTFLVYYTPIENVILEK